MTSSLLLPILIPALLGALALLLPRDEDGPREGALVFGCVANLAVAILLQGQSALAIDEPWGGFGFRFALKLTPLSGFIVLAAAFVALLVAVHGVAFMRGKPWAKLFVAFYLFTVALANGALLADDLLVLLFFWEGLMVPLFGMIWLGRPEAFKTAVKAFVIVGVADLCLMVGIGMASWVAHTTSISGIAAARLPVEGWAGLAFFLMVIGVLAKGGAMPFHSWIPDAALDAPMPFMALMPAAFEKLIGIYGLTRVTLDLFVLEPESWASYLLMTVGSVTILAAVLMALIQKDYKRLLSFHAISQVGYMVLGLGTAVPAGIVGGLFHMLNNALYKCALFLTAGAVEKQAGTTDLRELGGLARAMPYTCFGFVVAALSISGFPGTNGFYSKELIYDGALERGAIFYAAALLGSFFTAASFLKLGHAAFFDQPQKKGKLAASFAAEEASPAMYLPVLLLAALCLVFGLGNALPLKTWIQPALAARLGDVDFSGAVPHQWPLVAGTVIVLIAAWLNHMYGFKARGRGLEAVDHLHHAPVAHFLYDKAEQRCFDPYEWGQGLVKLAASVAWSLDRAVDFCYEKALPWMTMGLSRALSRAHRGDYGSYLVWSLAGSTMVVLAMFCCR